MANKRLSRVLSQREKVMLAVLVVIALGAVYYFAVLQNVMSTNAANEEKLVEIEDEIAVQSALATRYSMMQSELDAMGSLENLPIVSTYDNLSNEVQELNAILASASSYDLSFSDPELDGDTVRRVVSVSFTVSNYENALSIVDSLQHGKYRCEIRDISLKSKVLADGSTENVTGTLSVTFFETISDASKQEGLVEKSS